MSSRILAAAVVGVLGLWGTGLARAVSFSDVTLGAAGPGGLNFVAFQTGPTTFLASNSGTLFNGNVGLAAGGTTNFSGGGTIAGTLYVDPGATTQANITSQMNITGGINYTQSLAQALADVQKANATAAALAADQTYSSFGDAAATLLATGALNASGGRNTVIDITGDITITNPGKDLTISGTADDFFIINVDGNVTVSNGAILLSGGLLPQHVLFNLTGASSSVNLSNGTSVLNATYLAPNPGQSINLTPGTVNGAVIGYTLHTSSGPSVDGAGFVPEPSTLGILGISGLGLLLRRRQA